MDDKTSRLVSRNPIASGKLVEKEKQSSAGDQYMPSVFLKSVSSKLSSLEFSI